jgi:hypothetical protein
VIDIDKLEALAKAATLGKRIAYDENEGDGWPPRPLWCVKNEAYDSDDEEAPVFQCTVYAGGAEDAHLMAAADPEMIIALCAEIRMLREALK